MSVNPVIGKAAALVGAVFLLVGILGFIPGITTDYGQMQFAGHESEAMLLGLFQVSVLHNIVHLAYGVVGLAVMKNAPAARTYFIAGGATYLLLWVYGLVINYESAANFVPLNNADNWLHLGLGAGMIALGLLPGRRAATGAERPA
jgi:arginine exporter protein ArgO